jgi:DNA-binding transcriptional MocR family regulator
VDSHRLEALFTDWSSHGSGPLYRRLAEAIKSRMDSGDFPPGKRLPSERHLAAALAVSRTTVVAAFGLLRQQGRIESRRGSGSRVDATESLPPTDRSRFGEGSAEPVFRSLIEEPPTAVAFLGAHLPALADLLGQAMERSRRTLLGQFSHHGYMPLGLPALRRGLAVHLTHRGLPTREEEILVTGGAQQAISLVADALVRPSDSVLIEDPSYPGAIDAFSAAGARLRAIPVGEGSIARHLRQCAGAPRLAYLQPTFQNPTGEVLSSAERKEIALAAAKRNVPIVEDLTIADLSLDDEPPRPIAACAGRGAAVLTIGSFSKLYWGGLRVGWIRAPEPLIGRLSRVKALADLGTSIPSQAIAAALLGSWTAAREARRRQIAARLSAARRALERLIPEWSYETPGGGLTLWLRIPRGRATDFSAVALRHGVSVLPGTVCSPSGAHADRLRLPIVLEPSEIRDGVERLAGAWADFTKAESRRTAGEGVRVVV